MFSALKRLTTGGGTKVEAPGAGAGVTPMASSLQKKFSRGVQYNSEIFLFSSGSLFVNMSNVPIKWIEIF
jgi:hypothetical protein